MVCEDFEKQLKENNQKNQEVGALLHKLQEGLESIRNNPGISNQEFKERIKTLRERLDGCGESIEELNEIKEELESILQYFEQYFEIYKQEKQEFKERIKTLDVHIDRCYKLIAEMRDFLQNNNAGTIKTLFEDAKITRSALEDHKNDIIEFINAQKKSNNIDAQDKDTVNKLKKGYQAMKILLKNTVEDYLKVENHTHFKCTVGMLQNILLKKETTHNFWSRQGLYEAFIDLCTIVLNCLRTEADKQMTYGETRQTSSNFREMVKVVEHRSQNQLLI